MPLRPRIFARVRPYALLFLGLTVVYHANLRPVDSGDATPGSLIPFAIVLDHNVTLDRFVPWLRGHVWYTNSVIQESHGHFFSHFPIAGPLLATPLYLPIAFFFGSHTDPGSLVTMARIAGKFAATAITAFSAVLLLLLLKRITSSSWSWTLTLVYALATETWSISSQALWQEGPGELAIIGCFYCLERWWADRASNGWLWLCGACTAAAFAIRPTNAVLIPALCIAVWLARATPAQHIRLWTVPLFSAMALVGYNLYVFERPSGGYAMAILSGSILAGIAGLLFSPGRGLLIYTPVAIFAWCACLPSAGGARREHRPLLVTAILFLILEPLMIAPSISWWGGYTWGPRLLTELAPALVVLMAIGTSAMDSPWRRRAFATLALYSIFIQALGAFFLSEGALGRDASKCGCGPRPIVGLEGQPNRPNFRRRIVLGALRHRRRRIHGRTACRRTADPRIERQSLRGSQTKPWVTMKNMSAVTDLAANIRMLLMDVDGVLTDGKVFGVPDPSGSIVETKGFDTQDGIALQWLSWKGVVTGVISGRISPATEARAKQCDMTYVYQGHIEKIPIVEEILAKSGIAASQVAYIGDDLTDVVVMNRVGLSIAPANARPEVKRSVQYVTERAGGQGAVREVCELLLKAQGHWDDLLRKYEIK